MDSMKTTGAEVGLTPDEMENFLERSAIMEHEALLPRADAEKLAMECVLASRMANMTGREQARALARELRQ